MSAAGGRVSWQVCAAVVAYVLALDCHLVCLRCVVRLDLKGFRSSMGLTHSMNGHHTTARDEPHELRSPDQQTKAPEIKPSGANRQQTGVIDTLGNAIFMSGLGDLGLAHRHGSRTERRVALTFDDGPVAGGTEEVLDALMDYQAPGTFFCIGANVLLNPDILRRAYAQGHVIGAHSMNHSRLSTIAPLGAAHIDECVRAIADTVGSIPALFRCPWGWMTPWEILRLRRRGLHAIRWDIETPDSILPCPSAEDIATWTLPRVRPGSILVFHDGLTHAREFPKPETAQALRLIIPALREQGYEFVTIPDLLGISAYQSEGSSLSDELLPLYSD
jgi:peptidoglycan-N-acetylglucosamine deacetylase